MIPFMLGCAVGFAFGCVATFVFVAMVGWVLFLFVLLGALHVAAVIESNALRLQDMRLKNDTSDK